MTEASFLRPPEFGWRAGLRSVGRELVSYVDPTDPLRPFNSRLALAFTTHDLAKVAASRSFIPTEGHMLKPQAQFFQKLMRHQPWVRHVAEVGFNGGHSSWIFLSSRPDVTVTSFDLGEHEYVHMSKSLIDRLFPGRHELILGDSLVTIPSFSELNPERRFDLIYIDGGHDFDVARADINNCQQLASERSIVVMDDLTPGKEWGVGPVRAWTQAQQEGLIHEDLLVDNGFPTLGADISEIKESSQMWALGHYQQKET